MASEKNCHSWKGKIIDFCCYCDAKNHFQLAIFRNKSRNPIKRGGEKTGKSSIFHSFSNWIVHAILKSAFINTWITITKTTSLNNDKHNNNNHHHRKNQTAQIANKITRIQLIFIVIPYSGDSPSRRLLVDYSSPYLYGNYHTSPGEDLVALWLETNSSGLSAISMYK